MSRCDAQRNDEKLTSARLRACSVFGNGLLNEGRHARMRALPGSSEETSKGLQITFFDSSHHLGVACRRVFANGAQQARGSLKPEAIGSRQLFK